MENTETAYPAACPAVLADPHAQDTQQIYRYASIIFSSIRRYRSLSTLCRYLAFSAMRVEKNSEVLRYEDMRGLFSGRNRDPFAKKYSLPDKTGMVADRETV